MESARSILRRVRSIIGFVFRHRKWFGLAVFMLVLVVLDHVERGWRTVTAGVPQWRRRWLMLSLILALLSVVPMLEAAENSKRVLTSFGLWLAYLSSSFLELRKTHDSVGLVSSLLGLVGDLALVGAAATAFWPR